MTSNPLKPNVQDLQADLVNAWAYAGVYPEEIEQAIRENEAA